MQIFACLLILVIAQLCDARVASSETEVISNVDTSVKEKVPLHYPCIFRTLQAADPYPSVVVRYQNKVHRLTWNKRGDVELYEDYKQPTVSFSYPTSGGLSGDGGVSTTVKPFSDAPIVPENYDLEDIEQWFQKDCLRPY